MEPSPDREAVFHLQGNPAAEFDIGHAIHPCAKVHKPFWPVIDEKCTARLENANRFEHPCATPTAVSFDVILVANLRILVVFPKIKRWIGEEQVNGSLAHVRKQIQAVGPEQNSLRADVLRRNYRTTISVAILLHMWNIWASRYISQLISFPSGAMTSHTLTGSQRQRPSPFRISALSRYRDGLANLCDRACSRSTLRPPNSSKKRPLRRPSLISDGFATSLPSPVRPTSVS